MAERRFIQTHLAPLAASPAARGLRDDAAVWQPPLGRQLVLTHDTMVEGTHFLSDDPPADLGWKLVAVNLSDLAAKAATPAGALLSLAFTGREDESWQASFARGLGDALQQFGLALWGGDTVSGSASLVLGLTAIGHTDHAPARSGARPGDTLHVSGTIGDAGLGLAIASGIAIASGQPAHLPALAPRQRSALLRRLRRPTPRLALGQALGPLVTAMLDVSDGLLIDAQRLAEASTVGLEIDLDAIPLSPQAQAAGLDPLAAATSGDDYELLFTAPAGASLPPGTRRIGTVTAAPGLRLIRAGQMAPLPARLGFEHPLPFS